MEAIVALALLATLVYCLKKFPELVDKKEGKMETPRVMPPTHLYSETLKKQSRPLEMVRSLFKDIISILNNLGEDIEITCWEDTFANAETKYSPTKRDCALKFFIGREYPDDDQEKVAVSFQLLEFGPISELRIRVLHRLYNPSRDLFSLSGWRNDCHRLWLISFDADKAAREIHSALEMYRKTLPRIKEIETKKVAEINKYNARIKELEGMIKDTVNNAVEEIIAEK